MVSKPFKVMLATDADYDKLRFPLIATPKLDGIRAYVRGGVVLSRSNKPIPNAYVQRVFGQLRFEHYDGELIVGSPTSKTVYNETVSGVMSKDGEPDVQLYAFDHLQNLEAGWLDRVRTIEPKAKVKVHEFELITNMDSLTYYEEVCLLKGYEGLILRDPNGRYKQGRSTANEGLLLKMKRFVDAEAEIIGFEERMHNANQATVSETGHTKRSSHKANKHGRGDLGALVVRGMDGVEFNIGTGFTDADREKIWSNRERLLGQLVKFKYFPVGVKEAPRHPVFLGFRDRRDM